MNFNLVSKSIVTLITAVVGFQVIQGAQALGLQSKLFKGDPALEACLRSDPAHILPGAVGDHVQKIQVALKTLDNSNIDARELTEKRYGPSTAAAVLAFKQKRRIINSSYQTQADNIVGKMTMAALDKEMLGKERRRITAKCPGSFIDAVSLGEVYEIHNVTNLGTCKISIAGIDRNGRLVMPNIVLEPGQTVKTFRAPEGSVLIKFACFSDCSGTAILEYDVPPNIS